MPTKLDQEPRKNTGASFWRILGFALFLSAVTTGVTTCGRILDDYLYSIEDPIDRAGIGTKRALREYERTGDPNPLADWLNTYHGEAPSTQVMATLGEWAPWHRREFVTLLESIDPKDRRKLLVRLHFVLGDFGLDGAFWTAFGNDRSPVIDELRSAGTPEALRALTD